MKKIFKETSVKIALLIVVIVSLVAVIVSIVTKQNARVETKQTEEIEEKADLEVVETPTKRVVYTGDYICFDIVNELYNGLEDDYEVRMIGTPGKDIADTILTEELIESLSKAEAIVYTDCEKESWISKAIADGKIVNIKAIDVGQLLKSRDVAFWEPEVVELSQTEDNSEQTYEAELEKVEEAYRVKADASEKLLEPGCIGYIADVLSVILSQNDSQNIEIIQKNGAALTEKYEQIRVDMATINRSGRPPVTVAGTNELGYVAKIYGLEVDQIEEVTEEVKSRITKNGVQTILYTDEKAAKRIEADLDNEDIKFVKLNCMVNCSVADIDGNKSVMDMVKENVDAMKSSTTSEDKE